MNFIDFASPELFWAFSHFLLKPPTEIMWVFEPCTEGNLRNAQGGFVKQATGFFNFDLCKVLERAHLMDTQNTCE